MTPTQTSCVAMAVAAGGCAALQMSANAGLKTQLGGLWPALLVNTVLLFVLIAGAALVTRQPLLETARLPPVTSPLYVGGVCGFVILAVTAWVLPHLGAAQTIVLVVCGQGLAALLMDHFGLFGHPQVAISPVRLAGLVCLIVGVLLIRRGGPQ
ncbi:MAG: DMT family transporter [Planctomycetes bacterium]|nr:DMT family transporter [Planctomycetota bacterium]